MFLLLLLTSLSFALHHTGSLNYKRLYQVSPKITVVRPQPHLGVKTNDFHIDFFSFLQLEYASSRTSVLLSGRHILVNHQENAILGIKSHTVVIVVWPAVEVHLHINIVTTILGHLQSSIGILEAVYHMAFRVIGVPCGNY